jgi:hypothetical protein
MRLGTIETLREALGGRDNNGKLYIGATYARELKIATGMKGARFFDIEAVIQWRKERPNWRMPPQRRRNPASSCAPVVMNACGVTTGRL